MVNNSTNINKTNNHLSPKESLNCDGQQFHQYQQSEQSPLILTEVAEHNKTTTYDVENAGSNLEQEQTFGGIKPVNGIPTLPSW